MILSLYRLLFKNIYINTFGLVCADITIINEIMSKNSHYKFIFF